MEGNDMLVSVVVLTYNDSPFIEETLNSIKDQIYKNIELVVSDDCSSDDTVERCKRWIDRNGARFSNVQLLTVEKNTGVTHNITRAQKAAHGEWIKGLGGDDLLTPDCIEHLVRYTRHNPAASIIQCWLTQIDVSGNTISLYQKKSVPLFWEATTSAQQQHQILLRINPTETLGLFKKKGMLECIGYYDLEFPMQEDMSFIMTTTSQGYKVWLLNECLVKRRMRSSSLSGLGDKTLISKNDLIRIAVNEKYFKPYLGGIEKILLSMNDKVNVLIYRVPWLNKKKYWTKTIKRVLQLPYSIVRIIKLKQVTK